MTRPQQEFNVGLDFAIDVINRRIFHYCGIRGRTNKPMGVIEAELRAVAETLQKRRRAG